MDVRRYFEQRSVWGAMAILVGIVILLQNFGLVEDVGSIIGLIILLGGSACFLAVYYVRRDHFWPLIPGGVLLTLGLMSLIPGLGAGFFFLGLSATFAAVHFFSDADRRASWALIPAGVLFLVGLLIITAALVHFFFPVLLILGGLYLFRRATRTR